MRSFLLPPKKILACLCLLTAVPSPGQVVIYSFGSAGSPTTNPTTVATGLTASVFSGNLGSPAAGGTSPLYSAGSGGGYFGSSNWTGAAPGTNYFEFTLTPASGLELAVTTLSFGYRATSTGPVNFVVRSSADFYAVNLATGSLTGDSTWRSTGTLALVLAELDDPTTFRIFGSGASSSLGTFRIDDVTMGGAVSAIPEPSSYALVFGLMACAGLIARRRWPRGRREPE